MSKASVDLQEEQSRQRTQLVQTSWDGTEPGVLEEEEWLEQSEPEGERKEVRAGRERGRWCRAVGGARETWAFYPEGGESAEGRWSEEGPDSGPCRRPLMAAAGRTGCGGRVTVGAGGRGPRGLCQTAPDGGWIRVEAVGMVRIGLSVIAQTLHPQFLGSNPSSMMLSCNLEAVIQSFSISFFVKQRYCESYLPQRVSFMQTA